MPVTKQAAENAESGDFAENEMNAEGEGEEQEWHG